MGNWGESIGDACVHALSQACLLGTVHTMKMMLTCLSKEGHAALQTEAGRNGLCPSKHKHVHTYV